MSNDAYPLNGPQRRKITTFLAFAERDLQQLRNLIAHPPKDLRLTRYGDPIPPSLAPKLEAATADAEKQLHKIAADLHLSSAEEPVRRAIYSALSLEEVDLHELRPKRLRGYGEVNKDTAYYLETEIRMLQELLAYLNKLLLHGSPDTEDSTEAKRHEEGEGEP
jgi:hypothetical protein